MKKSFVYTVRHSLVNWPLWAGYFGSRDLHVLWRSGRCGEVKIRTNVWTVRPRPKKVVFSGDSTVQRILKLFQFPLYIVRRVQRFLLLSTVWF